MTPRPQLRVIKAYQPTCADPLQAASGERLLFERRATEWEGWLWCTDGAGRSSWLPEAWVRLEAEHCVLQRDYSAVELNVKPGDVLAVELIESGWAWVKSRQGAKGWVPLIHTEPV